MKNTYVVIMSIIQQMNNSEYLIQSALECEGHLVDGDENDICALLAAHM